MIRLTNSPSQINNNNNNNKGKGKRKRKQQQQQQRPGGSGGSRCAVCAYRILTPDVCLDVDFTKRVRNGRPEECWRVKYDGSWVNTYKGGKEGGEKEVGREEEEGEEEEGGRKGVYAGGVVKGGRVLTVGDGDLSFSVGVRRLLMGVEGGGRGGRYGPT